jgi:hypothetical protein
LPGNFIFYGRVLKSVARVALVRKEADEMSIEILESGQLADTLGTICGPPVEKHWRRGYLTAYTVVSALLNTARFNQIQRFSAFPRCSFEAYNICALYVYFLWQHLIAVAMISPLPSPLHARGRNSCSNCRYNTHTLLINAPTSLIIYAAILFPIKLQYCRFFPVS